MLTSSRKRHRSCDSEEDQQPPHQPKRPHRTPSLLVSDLDSESSSSDSSHGISSPECAVVVSARPCIHSQNHCASRDSLSRQPEDCTGPLQYGYHGDGSSLSYDCINRILREAHFSSLQMRARRGLT